MLWAAKPLIQLRDVKQLRTCSTADEFSTPFIAMSELENDLHSKLGLWLRPRNLAYPLVVEGFYNMDPRRAHILQASAGYFEMEQLGWLTLALDSNLDGKVAEWTRANELHDRVLI